MSIQAVSQTPVLPTAPLVNKPQAPGPAAKTEPSALEKGLDTFAKVGGGWAKGSSTTALVGGLGGGAMVYFSSGSNIPAFHKALGTIAATLGGAAAGAVVGGLGGAVAATFTDSKATGTAAGAATGAILGGAAVGVMMAAQKKGFDLPTIAGAALLGAGLGAIGGFASKAIGE